MPYLYDAGQSSASSSTFATNQSLFGDRRIGVVVLQFFKVFVEPQTAMTSPCFSRGAFTLNSWVYFLAAGVFILVMWLSNTLLKALVKKTFPILSAPFQRSCTKIAAPLISDKSTVLLSSPSKTMVPAASFKK